ncbi:hypothetical protein HELRODRAFT_191274 [Helobdella robusta]|uniref:SUEL-type lectin domain-containing protein n=1 Tax=Helobdella robusta TaxID=6412 RepID=T1FSU0_HELRO|nr:hypothetical protein HELRODRAFT_191274 [Helobdella robusta]ESO06996.1 hypothetical protein HELRODRAFT_191274 [Helobdella robusta]
MEVKEYCHWETFQPECRSDEVVVFASALYGRMRKGKCIKTDRDDIGCSTDVRRMADSRCSGRQTCCIVIPDRMFDSTSPCPEDLKVYFMASYMCVKATATTTTSTPPTTTLPHPYNELFNDNNDNNVQNRGFISSWAAKNNKSGCGTLSLPWIIKVKPGQKINLTLIDFYYNSSIANEFNGGDVINRHYTDSLKSCSQVIVIIREPTTAIRSQSVCHFQNQGVRNIYVTETNLVEVRVIAPNFTEEMGHFLVKYKAIGCPDLTPPATTTSSSSKAWWFRSRSNSDQSTFGCVGETWKRDLTCVDNKWVRMKKSSSSNSGGGGGGGISRVGSYGEDSDGISDDDDDGGETIWSDGDDKGDVFWRKCDKETSKRWHDNDSYNDNGDDDQNDEEDDNDGKDEDDDYDDDDHNFGSLITFSSVKLRIKY